MSQAIKEVEFRTWEAQQKLRFELSDGRPVRLPDEHHGAYRLARVRNVASRVLVDEQAVVAWMGTPLVELGGLEPEVLAADSEDGCELVLRELVRLGRMKDAAGG